MTIKVGDRMPDGTLLVATTDDVNETEASDYFANRLVVLFSVPGAFTPTCSKEHLPGFVANADALREKGVDKIACMAVNDLFVMQAWGEASNTGNSVELIADGNGDYTRALGLDSDFSNFGLGIRGKRFAMLVNDGELRQLFIEEGGGLRATSAEAMLKELG